MDDDVVCCGGCYHIVRLEDVAYCDAPLPSWVVDEYGGKDNWAYRMVEEADGEGCEVFVKIKE